MKFLKGVPTERKNGDDIWIYDVKRYLGTESVFLVEFKDNKIQYVMCFGDSVALPYLQGIRVGSNYSSIINKFGKPSFVSRSEDKLQRILSFEKYNVFFWLEQNRVIYYGMYNPRYGPVEFGKKKRE